MNLKCYHSYKNVYNHICWTFLGYSCYGNFLWV